MKKWISLFLALTLAVMMLAACGNPAAPGGTQTQEEGQGTEGEGTTEGGEEGDDKIGLDASNLGQAELKIAIVSSPSGVDDGNFNENIYNGILKFIDDNKDSTVTPIREETGDVAACLNTVQDIVADYDVIVCCGFQFAGIGEIAKENSEVFFLLVDTAPTDKDGNEVELPNVYSMLFKEQESGFCAGMAAALETKTGKVAVVNGVAYPSNVNYQYGFMSGVNYANKYCGASAEIVELPSYAGTDVTGANVGGNYVGGFGDVETGKELGNALYDAGVDIIFVAAGASGNGVFTAAKEKGDVFVIGCDVDQYKDGVNGDKNIVLTSVLKVMDRNVMMRLVDISTDNFVGKNALLGADSRSTGFVSDPARCQLSAETITKIEEAFEKVASGEIVPAANFNGMTPDSFTGY